MTEDKETLREAEYFRQQVAVDIAIALYNKAGIALTDEQSEIAADAGIASMFERLQTPITDALKFAYCQGARDVDYKLTGDTETTEDDFGEAGDDYAAFAVSELFTAFQQENSDGR